MPYSVIDGTVGYQQISPFNLPDTTARQQPGFIVQAVDNYWGAGEFIYAKANGAVRQFGLCVLTPVVASGAYSFNATEVPNTANLGRTLAVAMTVMDSGEFGWFCIGGVVPVNCSASVAADTTFGIAAAGQGGANAAGKQVLNARNMVAAAATVAKANSVANSGSTRLQVSNSDGWFTGIYLSGTGIAAGTTVSEISPDGTQITLSLATTAAVNGTVTGTYNNATVFYNVAYINRPFAQGAIT
jgi:hypothetical protein